MSRRVSKPFAGKPSGICSVCDIRKHLTGLGNVKEHSRHGVRCAGSLSPPRLIRERRLVDNWARTRREVIARDGSCRKCGLTDILHVHHIKERCQGGQDIPDNLVTLCEPCHLEWTYNEPASAIATFEAWLEVPPVRRLVALWVFPWPTDMSAADFKKLVDVILRDLPPCGAVQ